MSSESTLRKAVIADPDDDTPRLAYADWCAQQTDPITQARAEFIRAQIAVAQGASSGVHALIHTIQTLAEAHGAAWAAPVVPYVRAFQFLRGFVEHVELSARALLDHGAELYTLAPIRHVDLLEVRHVDEALFASPLLANLRSLGLDRLGLYDIHLQLLAASPDVGELRWLSGVGNNFGFDGYVALVQSTSLTKLAVADFMDNPVDPVERLHYDGTELVAVEMPDAGQLLEQRLGRVEWLHREGKTTSRHAQP